MNRFHVRVHWSADDDWSGWYEADSIDSAVRLALRKVGEKARIPIDRAQVTVTPATPKDLALMPAR